MHSLSIRYSTIKTKEAARIGKFFCFNNNVSNLYNNSVVEKNKGYGIYFYTFNV